MIIPDAIFKPDGYFLEENISCIMPQGIIYIIEIIDIEKKYSYEIIVPLGLRN
jgi:hypothetical protein